MIDLSSVEGFDWDEGNSRKSLDKHGVGQIEAEQVLLGGALVSPDIGHSKHEERFQALGETIQKRGLHVTFTLRDEGRKIRVISARDMNRKERAIYDQST
jgi:uncharacterized DUF497 family protein